MSFSRTNILLLVVLLAQVGLAAFIYLDDDDTASTSLARGGDLVRDFNPDAITGVILEDDSGNQLQLALTDGAWVLPTADDFPAQSARVQELLSTIQRLQADQLITRTANSHRRLQVAADAFYRQVTLLDAEGDTTTIYVGSTGGGRTRHVRLNGEDAVYLSDAFAAAQLDPIVSSWVNTVYFSLPTEQITHVRIENANGITDIDRVEGVWRVDGLATNQVTDVVRVNPIGNALANFRLTEPLGLAASPDYGMDAPLATVTVTLAVPDPNATTTDDAAVPTITETHVLTIGAPSEAGYYAKYDGSPYYVVISSATGDTFINATPATLATDQIFAIFGG